VPKIAVLSHVTSAGVAGGGTSTNTNNTRTLNTISDPYSITSLSSNQFTLQPGMYHIEAHSTCFQIDNTYIRIRNITDTTTAIMGTSEVASAADNSTASPSLSGYVTITSAKTFELQHYSATAKATNGLGVSNGTGETNTYATVTITKIR
jgi:hypothetical protein